ncbi:MAG: sulfotransferase domain-containing protein [Planctomycetota bacterium]
MLLIFNGAPKGGSTWLLQIVTALDVHDRIPEAYQQAGWANSSLDPERVDAFLGEVDLSGGQYFCKQHWWGEAWHRALLGREDVRVLNIIRDLRDVVVSRYFHDMRLGALEQGVPIDAYYWKHRGRARAEKYIECQLFWHGDAGAEQPWLASYERLHADFAGEVRGLFEHIGLAHLGDEAIARAREATDLKNRPSETGEGKFFRKGIVGDWRNHLSDEIVEDLDGLIAETGYASLLERVGSAV